MAERSRLAGGRHRAFVAALCDTLPGRPTLFQLADVSAVSENDGFIPGAQPGVRIGMEKLPVTIVHDKTGIRGQLQRIDGHRLFRAGNEGEESRFALENR